MQDYELDAYLDGFDATPEQRAQLAAISDLTEARYATEGDDQAEAAAFAAATEVILGDNTLKEIAAEWLRARQAEREMMTRLTGAIIAAHHTGLSQLQIADKTGINRRTVRKALGQSH